MAETEVPEVILMDLDLPIINGWDATRRIRASPESRRIPIVALSAHAMSNDKDKALAAECDEFETTPVNLERLLQKIAKLTR